MSDPLAAPAHSHEPVGSARDTMEALIAGERDPRVPAELARGGMRHTIPDLTHAGPPIR